VAVKTEFQHMIVTISHLHQVTKYSFKRRKDTISHLNVTIKK